MKDPKIRFWNKVQKTDTCWNWTASLRSKNSPYGCFKFNGKTELTHRLAYTWLVGEIPPNLTVDHLCKNTKCCNPKHMELLSLSENVKRAQGWLNSNPGAHNLAKTHCPKYHPYDSINTYITPSGRRDCKECRRAACRRNYHRKKSR